VRAVLGHAVAFSTWRSLTAEQGIEAKEARVLMCALVESVAAGTAPGRRAARPGTG
jgi:hypothetical protein